MSSDAYKTIEAEYKGEFKDRGSKFIGYIFPILTEADFQTRLALLRKEHLKARHHCTAFRLRDGLERSSDDGEPSGSAGKPIMNQLLSKEVVDVGCIVVRYFGGTKLGVSGLINAYKVAAQEALYVANILTKYETLPIIVAFDYAQMGTLMDAVKYFEIKISSKELNAAPSLTLEVNASEAENTIIKLKAKLLNRSIADITDETELKGVKFKIAE